MAGSTENLHESVEEASSHPEPEAVNSEALHDSLEAPIENDTNDTDKPIEDAILTAGDSPKRETSDEASASVHPAGAIVANRQTDSLTGWVTKSNCCDEFSKKLFASGNDTERRASTTASYRDSQSEKADNSPGFKGKLDELVDRLDHFVHDTTKQVDKIDKRLKSLENPNKLNSKKLDWAEDL